MDNQTPKKPTKKAKASTAEPARKIRTIPKLLLAMRFDDTDGWLKAYRSFNVQDVARAVMMAFRRRYFLSQKSAAEKIGVSTNTWNKWESGAHSIRWNSKEGLVKNGWFKPQHFGLDADPAEFESEAEA